MVLGEKIKENRERLGLTQDELAEKLGTTPQAIYKYEKGIVTNVPLNKLEQLARIFGVRPFELTDWHHDDLPKSGDNFQVFEQEPDLITFDIVGTIRAGFGHEAVKTYTGEKVQVPRDYLHSHRPEDYFALRVSGDSMYPRLLDGDIVLVYKTTSVDSGDTAAIMYNGEEATVKKVRYVSGEDWLELIPANPEFKTKRIEGADLEQCRVLGKVTKLIRDI